MANLPVIGVDHIQIEQVLIDLIRNSIDAILGAADRQQGEISIQSQLTLDNKIQVSVKNNGPGIEEDQQAMSGDNYPVRPDRIVDAGHSLVRKQSLIKQPQKNTLKSRQIKACKAPL